MKLVLCLKEFAFIGLALLGTSVASALLLSCANDPIEVKPVSTLTASGAKGQEGAQVAVANSTPGTRVELYFDDFYTHRNPNANNCAGDLKTYYKLYDLAVPGVTASSAVTDVSTFTNLSGYAAQTLDEATYTKPRWIAFDTSVSYADESTVRPSFIRNISVDMTDANATLLGNEAAACALPAKTSPTSSCATFDYGAVGGIPTSLGGTLILMGGVSSGLSNANSLPSKATESSSIVPHCGSTAASTETSSSDQKLSECSSGFYAVGIDKVPADSVKSTNGLTSGLKLSNEAVSVWGTLGTNVDTTLAPASRAGASMAQNPSRGQLILFGGSTLLDAETPQRGADVLETWTFDLKTQTWAKQDTQVINSNDILSQKDYYTGSSGAVSAQYSRESGGRAGFGYIAMPRTGLQRFSSNSLETAGSTDSALASSARVLDDTDRIFILGGGATGKEYYFGRKFNPTFGPEYRDQLSHKGGVMPAAGTVLEWLETYPAQLITNGYRNDHSKTTFTDGTDFISNLKFRYPTNSTKAAGGFGINFGAAPILDDKTSYFWIAGGFDYSTIGSTSGNHASYSIPDDTGTISGNYNDAGAGKLIFSHQYKRTGDTDFSLAAASFLTNSEDGSQVNPVNWEQNSETGLKWYGGGLLLPGLDESQQDLLYIGGSTCINYLTDSAVTAADCKMGSVANGGNVGAYFRLGAGKVYFKHKQSNWGTLLTGGTIKIGWTSGSPPVNAGMAGARGYYVKSSNDSTPYPMILVWGGFSDPGKAANSSTDAYILYGNSDLTQRYWVNVTPTGDAPPASASIANSSMVYSHVTGKYYLFGGMTYDSNNDRQTLNKTYEISVSWNASTSKFEVIFKELKEILCLPSDQNQCPAARRSHKMVEVNYNHNHPTESATSLKDCDSNKSTACSFAIFMEGGANGSSSYLSDRWLFDPTANGARGLWTRVDDFPPRHFAALASLSYEARGIGQVDRAVLFGGETGLANPNQIRNDGAYDFVPPTLGDTMMYDFQQKSWNRVKLLGKGYYTSFTSNVSGAATEMDFRSHFITTEAGGTATFSRLRTYAGDLTVANPAPTYVTDETVAELAPPPLAGALSLTRTLPKALATATTAVTPLAIPEIYVMGGRKKDGTLLPLNQIYKFCSGSPGEWVPPSTDSTNDNAQCDAYNATYNPRSPVTNEAVGRWIRKNPVGTAAAETGAPVLSVNIDDPLTVNDSLNSQFEKNPTDLYSYLGAGAYDSYYDRMAIYGGWTYKDPATDSGNSITKSETRALNSGEIIYEYRAPYRINTAKNYEYHGFWRKIPRCTYDDDSKAPAPVGRYGHSMAYDTVKKQFIIVGGYNEAGTALTQTVTNDSNSSYTLPEIWTAKRVMHSGLVSLEDEAVVSTSSVFPCYHYKQKTKFGNDTDIASQAVPNQGLIFSAASYIPATGYNSGYYTMLDDNCLGAGPVGTPGSDSSRKYIGGVYIDLDRSKLASDENVLLHLTYLPLGPGNQRPDGQPFSQSEQPMFRINLVKNPQTLSNIQSQSQPRGLGLFDDATTPTLVQSLSILGSPDLGVRQEQVLIPLSTDAEISRIQIQRVSGSAVLIDLSLVRMGPPTE